MSAILGCEQSHAATESQVLKLRDAVLASCDLLIATGRDGLSRGVLLVKAVAGKPVVVGVGYCASNLDRTSPGSRSTRRARRTARGGLEASVYRMTHRR